jgi:hypothetical protein
MSNQESGIGDQGPGVRCQGTREEGGDSGNFSEVASAERVSLAKRGAGQFVEFVEFVGFVGLGWFS